MCARRQIRQGRPSGDDDVRCRLAPQRGRKCGRPLWFPRRERAGYGEYRVVRRWAPAATARHRPSAHHAAGYAESISLMNEQIAELRLAEPDSVRQDGLEYGLQLARRA